MALSQIAEIGNLTLVLGLVVSLYLIFAAIFSQRKQRPEFLVSVKHGVWVIAGLTTLAVFILEWALLTHQFRFEYVASHVSRDQPVLYTVSALWGGQEGSLLFWVWLLSLFSAAVLIQHFGQRNPLVPWVIAFMAFTQAFFFALLVFITGPFTLLAQTPADGPGRPLRRRRGGASLGGGAPVTVPRGRPARRPLDRQPADRGPLAGDRRSGGGARHGRRPAPTSPPRPPEEPSGRPS